MRLIATLLVLLSIAATAGGIGALGQSLGPQKPPPPPTVLTEGGMTAFTDELRNVAVGWNLQPSGDTVVVQREFLTHPMNAATMNDVDRQTFTLTVTISPYLKDAAQRARLAKELKAERAAWRLVEKLECDGMEFNDHFIDGFCFRAKTDEQERRVATWRAARDRWLAVPRFHRGQEFSVALRGGGIELADGPCRDCKELERKISALLTAYPQ